MIVLGRFISKPELVDLDPDDLPTVSDQRRGGTNLPDLTVMTWNIQNLFPVGHADGPPTQQEYDDKIAGFAKVINAVEPDLLALQEVGPEQVLADLERSVQHRL